MTESGFQAVADAVAHWVTAAGIIVGGAWAWFRFGITRQREAAISVKLSCVTTEYGTTDQCLAAISATIKNSGSVKLEIRRARETAYPCNSNDTETLKYGADLLLRRLGNNIPVGAQVHWFPSPTSRSPLHGDIELDLLSAYENDGETRFWMEPGESYCLGTAVVLAHGLYLALLTIVGENSDDDFWRSEFILTIPERRFGQCVMTPQ
jgi:hypothetical protein